MTFVKSREVSYEKYHDTNIPQKCNGPQLQKLLCKPAHAVLQHIMVLFSSDILLFHLYYKKVLNVLHKIFSVFPF